MFVVIIEWDGRKPPSAFYRRLRRLAARGVRGDKSLPALERRLGPESPGVIVQEGAILVPSESLARALALLARGYGAAYVQVGRVRLMKDLAPSPDDIEAMRRVEEALGRRGRPPEEGVWTVACRECLTTHRIEAVVPLNCPRCGGVRLGVRAGEPDSFAPPDAPLFDAWLRTRFAHGAWEPALLGDGQPPPMLVVVRDPREHKVVARIKEARGLLATLERLPLQVALQALDAVFVARAYWSREQRQAARLEAAAEYFSRGGDPSGVVLAEGDTPDLLDAAGPLGPARVAALLLTAVTAAASAGASPPSPVSATG